MIGRNVAVGGPDRDIAIIRIARYREQRVVLGRIGDQQGADASQGIRAINVELLAALYTSDAQRNAGRAAVDHILQIQLQEAVRLNPGAAQAHADLADVLAAQGRLENAASEYRRAVELNPEAYAAHLSLGEILARGGNMAEARAHIEKAAQSPDPEIRQAAQKALH